jgi:hypothetical protein
VGERVWNAAGTLDGSPSDLELPRKNILEFGSSSGIETMYGLLYAYDDGIGSIYVKI